MNISIALVALAQGCASITTGCPNSPLMEDFVSGMSPEEVQSLLRNKYPDPVIVEDDIHGGSDGVPKFHIYALEVHGYHHGGIAGNIRMTYYNGRLMEIRFLPDNYQLYLRAIYDQYGIKQPTKEGFLVNPSTMLWADQQPDGQWYVGWVDTCLREEKSDWVNRYS